MSLVTLVIPVFNEEALIDELYSRVTSAAETWGCDFEILVVNDGSHDRTGERLLEITSRDPRWKVVEFSRNFGHQAAVSAGIFHASGDAVAIMDGDLQDPPEAIAQLLAKWREGFEVVYAVRTNRKESFVMRAMYAGFYRLLSRLATIDIPLDAGDFCVMDRRVVEVLNRLPEKQRFVRGLRSWCGFEQIGVTYERAARHAGQPKYTLRRLLRLASDGVLSFSSVPLRVAGALGVAMCGLSFLMVALLVLWWWSDATIFGYQPKQGAGWTSIVSLVFLLSGTQMLFIGVLGEYIARMYDEVKARPTWVVSRTWGISPKRSEAIAEQLRTTP